MIRPLLIALVAASLSSACTWVKMEQGGASVRVAREGEDLSYCTRRGEVAVSVRDQVGFYERNELKVRDELEVLARNEAPGLNADTLQALDEPLNGEQRFTAYACRGTRGQTATAPAPEVDTQPRAAADAETFPAR
jgi:hypothetical protein